MHNSVQAFKFFCKFQKLIEGKFKLLSRLGELVFVCRVSFYIPVPKLFVFGLRIMVKGLQDVQKRFARSRNPKLTHESHSKTNLIQS